jgi:hypothetical protein
MSARAVTEPAQTVLSRFSDSGGTTMDENRGLPNEWAAGKTNPTRELRPDRRAAGKKGIGA